MSEKKSRPPGRRLAAIPAGCLFLLFSLFGRAQSDYWVKSGQLAVRLSAAGRITGIRTEKDGPEKKLEGFSALDGCVQQGATRVLRNKNGSLVFVRTLTGNGVDIPRQNSCTITETFRPTASSIRWEITIQGKDNPWASRINTIVHYPASEKTRFWTAWGSPTYNPAAADQTLKEKLKPLPGGGEDLGFFGKENDQWVDPLHAVPFADTLLYYGLPYFTYENPRIGVCPFQGNLFAIPMCSILEPEQDAGLSLALSPEDDIIDLLLNTKQDGSVQFSRLFNRISRDHPLSFSLDIVRHAGDWREGLAWMAGRYPRYFEPQNKEAYQLAGTGAYAGPYAVPDNDQLREMDFKTNWQSSFDFPYMGMFLPPVPADQVWKRYGDSSISANVMADYARQMKKAGFHVLNYFNVTEFGKQVKYPAPTGPVGPESDWWSDCNTFLYKKIPGGILKAPEKMRVAQDEKTKAGGPLYTWGDGIAMDCGDPAYKAFLIGQARRHIQEIPDADGICIDRMDWLRFFNESANDGSTWFDGRPARSLVHSFKQLLDTLGPLMHRAGKNIFVNNHDKRIDLLNNTDGIFDEFTYLGAPLNLTAFLSLARPALGWTDAAATVKNEGGDNFFQKYLYMGVFPMCPYPANDHSIKPDSAVDRYYRDYGPLLHLLRGRRWVLKAHPVSADGDLAKVNLFETPAGYVIPVVYGKEKQVRVRVDESAIKRQGKGGGDYAAWYPGISGPRILSPVREGKYCVLDIPLVKGCAMVSVTR